MGRRRRPGPHEPNRVSIREYQELASAAAKGWLEWERDVDGILKVNGWRDVWRDRVIPRSVLKGLGLTRRQEDDLIALLQKIGRQRGLPDRLAGKEFRLVADVPAPLLKLAGSLPAAQPGGFAITGFIECKTGRATTTPKQERWLRIARRTPGMFGVVARPTRRDWLVDLLGGERSLLMARKPQTPYAEQALVPAEARAASGQGEVFEGYGEASTLRLQLLVSAAAASAGVTPTLDVVVEDTLDGANWNVIHAFAQVTAAGNRQVANVTVPFADRVRVRWTIGGAGASFTFGVVGVSQLPSVA